MYIVKLLKIPISSYIFTTVNKKITKLNFIFLQNYNSYCSIKQNMIVNI